MSRTEPTCGREGMTRTELLTVIAVVSVIAAIVLPAIQRHREIARKTECSRNLIQIGLALHTYVDGTGVLPPAIFYSPDSSYTPRRQASGFTGWVMLLPYVSLGLYDQFDFGYGSMPGTVHYSTDPESPAMLNQELTGLQIRAYSCPSDKPPNLANNFVRPGICVNALKSNYLFAAGANFNPLVGGPLTLENPAVPYNEAAPFYGALFEQGSTSMGIFGHTGAATFDQISDGLSNTIMVGESLQDHAGGDRSAVVWGQGKLYGQMAVVDGFGVATAKYPNPPASKTTINHTEPTGRVSPAVLSSRHGRGAHVLFADGSVRFLPQDIAVEVYNTLFMIRDGAELPDSY